MWMVYSAAAPFDNSVTMERTDFFAGRHDGHTVAQVPCADFFAYRCIFFLVGTIIIFLVIIELIQVNHRLHGFALQ